MHGIRDCSHKKSHFLEDVGGGGVAFPKSSFFLGIILLNCDIREGGGCSKSIKKCDDLEERSLTCNCYKLVHASAENSMRIFFNDVIKADVKKDIPNDILRRFIEVILMPHFQPYYSNIYFASQGSLILFAYVFH